MTAMTMTTHTEISKSTMNRSIDDNNFNDCVADDDSLRSITPRFKVVTSDESRDLLSIVWVLGSADAVRVKGKEED